MSEEYVRSGAPPGPNGLHIAAVALKSTIEPLNLILGLGQCLSKTKDNPETTQAHTRARQCEHLLTKATHSPP